MSQKYTLFLFFILLAFTVQAQVFYVVEGTTGSGTSWQDASGDLAAVLENATAGTEVWVAAGTYYPISCSPCSETDRDTPFEIKDSVALYGGFNGTETAVDQRDWQANPSILSGDIDQDGTLENNAQTIIYTRHVSAATLLDGFIISGGYADLSAAALGHRRNSGAAWFNDGQLNGFSSHPTIKNCTFSNNTAAGYGGGMYNNAGFGGASHPVFINCTFSGNSAAFGGGGVFNQANFSGTCNALFTDCTFTGNESLASGGGVYNQGAENGNCNPVFNDCIFYGNNSGISGGGVVNVGRNSISSPEFNNCLFDNNHSDSGGGMYNDASVGGLCLTKVDNCTFTNNLSEIDGGGIFNLGSGAGTCNIILSDCLFENNHSGFAGGGIFNNGIEGESSPTVINCKFLSNTADTYGGGVYNLGKTGISSPKFINCLFAKNTGSSAGGMYNLGSVNGNSSPEITNCTFYGNSANVGGAVYNNADDATGNANAVITNTIFWNNRSDFGAVFRNIFGTPIISYSIVDQPDCFSLNNGAGSDVSCGTGMIYGQYPMFEDTLANDFRLHENSPAIDVGDNIAIDTTGILVDLSHELRISNGAVDIGAYENSGTYAPPQITHQPESLSLCEGESANFVVEVSGTTPFSFQWLHNGNLIPGANGESFQISETDISNQGNYNCMVISAIGDTVVSGIAILETSPLLVPVIDIVASSINSCEGNLIEFIAFTNNAGTAPIFQWTVNSENVGTDSVYFSSANLNDGDIVRCRLTSSENCLLENPVNADEITITINDNLEVATEIEASLLEICSGETVVITASAINEGANPQYQWLLNGNLLVETGPEISLNTLTDGDEVYCLLTSSETCVSNNSAASNELSFVVHPLLEADINLSASDLEICDGDEVSFEVLFSNGGANPSFQWLINGNETGENEPVFASSNIENGDDIQCVMISSEECVMNNPVTSSTLQIAVMDNLEPQINISGPDTILCVGEEITFTSQIQHGGPNPHYDWQINGASLNINEPELISNDLTDGNEVSCMLTSSEACFLENPVLSNSIIVSVDSCLNVGVSEQVTPSSIKVYPNPSDGNFFLQFEENLGALNVVIVDAHGKLVYETHFISAASQANFIQAGYLPKGLYFIKIYNDSTSFIAKQIVH